MPFSEVIQQYCGDTLQPLWGFIDLSIGAAFMYYAYVPALVVSVMMILYLLPRMSQSLRARPLVLMLTFFVLWLLGTLVQWIGVRHDVIMLAWQLTMPFEIGFYLSAAYFAYVFVLRRDMPVRWKAVFVGLGTLFTIAAPTTLNIASYDLSACEGISGGMWPVQYAIEGVICVGVLIFGGYWAYREKDKQNRDQSWIFTVSFSAFLSALFLSNAYGEATGIYELNFLAIIGMMVFFAVLAYLIVKYHAFHSQLIATEALVWGLVILVGSHFFFATSAVAVALDAFAFVAAAIIGYLQIKMVKLEISRKEELAELLKQRESLQHLVTHKVKGAFTRTKFIFSEMLSGTFGPMTDKAREMSRHGLEFSDDGINSVDQVLNAANLKKGKVTYEMKPVDFKAVVRLAIEQKAGPAEKKGLRIIGNIADEAFMVNGDAFWLKEVAYNLVDNAVKYTPSGTITVSLERHGKHLQFSVKDTGGGISDEDKKKLFTEGGRGRESTKINPDSTGYGLYTIKLVVTGHKGKVWAESTLGQGATFVVTLPLMK